MNYGDTRLSLNFWYKVKKPDPLTVDPCWIWTGATTSGYPAYWDPLTQRMVRAHRYVYDIAQGHSPKRLESTCGNRRCVNPMHYHEEQSRVCVDALLTEIASITYDTVALDILVGMISSGNVGLRRLATAVLQIHNTRPKQSSTTNQPQPTMNVHDSPAQASVRRPR